MAESQRLAALRSKVQEQPCDQDAWDDLIEELRAQRDVTAVREAYEALLAEFPTAVGVVWCRPRNGRGAEPVVA